MDVVAYGVGRKLVTLDRTQCLRLLTTVPVGRLIFTMDGLPAVKMMNFVLADGLIVLRSAPGTAADRKAPGSVVALEADMVDTATSSGWSVTVIGQAGLVTDADVIASYTALPLARWAPDERDHFVTISTDVVRGQRILPG